MDRLGQGWKHVQCPEPEPEELRAGCSQWLSQEQGQVQVGVQQMTVQVPSCGLLRGRSVWEWPKREYQGWQGLVLGHALLWGDPGRFIFCKHQTSSWEEHVG